LNNYAENWGIPFSLKDFENVTGCLFDVELTSDQTLNYKTGGVAVIGPQIFSDDFDQVNNDPTDHAFDVSSGGTVYGYQMRKDGTYDFKATIEYDASLLTGTQQCIIQLGVTDNLGGVQSQVFASQTLDASSGTGVIELNAYGVQTIANRYVVIVFVLQEVGVPGGSNFTVDIIAGTKLQCTQGRETYLTGDKINIADTLPNIKIKDLYLFEAVRKSALIIADNRAKTLQFVTLDSIKAKWPIAKDWTDKVDFTAKPKREYRLGDFAQQNDVRWKDGTEDDPAFRANPDLGNYILSINDGALELEKEMYTAPFAATVEADSFTDNFHARVLRYSGCGIAYDAPDINPEPRAMPLVSRTSNLVQITSGGGTVTNQIMGEPETWAEIAEANWTAFESMLDKMKLVNYMVRLSAIDIQELDVTVPVKVRDDYFMIREVEQWPANKVGLTKVKLIRL
jgi:hypothetical protein